ncbi:transcriptional regulator [Robbsia andropogonis]|uniref:Transcriptional regulator n=1 Tax=Robbsia andropogonis TaxID=28092 RepID=A0A0F5JXI6_9BURK|nr:CysB family HTH-type transcriptional regulator [Robbsia andropogonis]KKB62354.1 transcriptional regulator [Robbsia andropogonis]MCP1119938.1 CysB family HTH-type transcriptional regulator [Robbsia andropogonis]MCP1129808.1 CysB family HTH-type transcriptional regulator [Robbsia andropogonis]
MNFQQLRYVREAARRNLNLTEVANVLHTSQSGVSKQIKDFEDELGIEIFVRRGKRLTALTDPGTGVLKLIERILLDTENLKRAASHYAAQEAGRLVLATTHTQARYALPKVIERFREAYPKVHLALRQGSPTQVAEMVLSGEADLGIATEALNRYPDITTFSSYSWHHVITVRRGHPLAEAKQVGLADIAGYPIITYDKDFSGRPHIDAAFEKAGLAPDIVLTAMDADVIKTYVEVGLGVGILAAMAVDPVRDDHLVVFDTPDMFEPNTTRIGIRNGTYLRTYTYRLIEMLAPHLREDEIRSRLSEED